MHAADLLSKRADLTPTREALLENATGRRFTYAELNKRANQAAHWLIDCGVGEGDRVSILAHNCVAFVDLLFACGKIGAVFTPLNWRLVASELAYIVDDCQPRVLIFDEPFAVVVAELRTQHLIEEMTLLAEYEACLHKRPFTEPPRPQTLSGDSPYCILYTSGTTGRPKGAIIPHRQVLWNAINTVISWELTAVDVSPIFTPMFHSGGLFVFLTPLFYVGGRIIITQQFDPTASLRIIEQEGCTVVLGVPTLFQEWLKDPVFEQVNFSQMRWFISGGAPCPPTLISKWRQATNRPLRQGYGLTEVGTNCFCMSDEESVTKLGSVGKPIFHSQMRLVDKEGRDVPLGQTGELLIRGPHVCAGYFGNREATAVALRDGWFHTGDMARQDSDGYFYIVGRFKDMIISGGENVYAAEVEAAYVAHTAVADCALIGQPDEKWGEVGLLIVVLADGETVTEAVLKEYGRQHLAGYKVPKQFIFTDSLPYSPYGKVMKAELKQKFLKAKL